MRTQRPLINLCRARVALPAASAMALLVLGGVVRATTGTTTRVSVDSTGVQANRNSFKAAISADGRFVAFDSLASNLVANDTNGQSDVFVHDRDNGQTTRVSVASGGAQANIGGADPSISADGRFVAFASLGWNLVTGDTNEQWDVFVHDRETGQTTRVSVDSPGSQGNSNSFNPAISEDGRFVAFESFASNLAPGDSNSDWDVFVHDRQTGETTRVSVDSGGAGANGYSVMPSISFDGRFVAFASRASNLVAGDTDSMDVFVHDRQTGQTIRVSVNSGGTAANAASSLPSISADGRFVAFESFASNLAALDTNSMTDVFVHDRETRETARVSSGFNGSEANYHSGVPAISSGGRFIAFTSYASNLVAGDTDEMPGVYVADVFIHDRARGQTTKITENSDGMQINNGSSFPAISADGRFVAFLSHESQLVSGDTNESFDVFVYFHEPLLADSTSPVLILPSTITVDAVSPAGAVVGYTVSASDDVDPAPAVSCAPAAGSLFPMGMTRVVCTATDASGNSTSGHFTVLVKSAAAQIADLIAQVTALNAKQGIVNSLDAKLQNVLGALESANAGQVSSACSKLTAFIYEVQAQVGKAIPLVDANRLIADAQRIKAVIGCE